MYRQTNSQFNHAIEAVHRPGRKPTLLLLFLVSAFAWQLMAPVTPALAAPSFDCRKAFMRAEKTICASPRLARLDARMAALYQQMLSEVTYPDAWTAEQRQWLQKRNKCAGNISCLQTTYTRRIALLRSTLANFARGRAAAEEERKLDADFTTLEDGRHIADLIERKDFRWHTQKRFIARIVERTLLLRGFGPMTSRYIAHYWDAWRFDPENGRRLIHKSPMAMNEDDAVHFAHALPSCLMRLDRTTCRMRYAPELGCKYQPPLASFCQRRFDQMKRLFTTIFAMQPKGDAPSLLQGHESYLASACLSEGEKGADLAVFAPKDVEAATKLVFRAKKRADAVVIEKPKPQSRLTGAVKRQSCQAMGISSNGSEFSGHVTMLDGRSVWVHASKNENPAEIVRSLVAEKRRKGQKISRRLRKANSLH